jgi:iron complex outermembrane receptor protein
MKRFKMMAILLAIIMVGIPQLCIAEQEVMKVGDIQVTAPREKEGIVVAPSTTTINVDEYKVLGTPQNIVDILKDRAIIDFRGQSDLVPESDSVYMRGFDTRNFVTAQDGLAIEKTGGHWGGHFVDYSLIPLNQIECIEIIPGPHSALYSGKALGGVINIKTKTPAKHEAPEANFKVTTSYRTYNTQNHSIDVQGGVDWFDYGLSYQKYHTDGYLRNNDADMDTVSGRLGFILPSDGYISLNASYTDKETGQPMPNDPDTDNYDSSYPVVKKDDVSSRWRNDPDRNPERYKEPYSLRLNMKQPTPIGSWTLGAYYSYDNQVFDFKDMDEPQAKTCYTSWGGNIQDEIELFDNHLITVGFDTAQLSSGHTRKIVESYAGFIQDKWNIIPRLTLTAGLRYENMNIWWNNLQRFQEGIYVNPAKPRDYVKRGYNQVVPKSFLTYELDDLSDALRDTSMSIGVSRIWTPRSFCEV